MGFAIFALLVALAGTACLLPDALAYLAAAPAGPLIDVVLGEIVGHDDLSRRWRLWLVSLVVGVVALQLTRVPLWRAIVPRPARLRLTRMNDLGRIVLAITLERLLVAIVLAILTGWALGEWHAYLSCDASPQPCRASDLVVRVLSGDVDQGRATVVVAVTTVLGALIAYLMRIRSARLNTARSVLREIEVKHAGNSATFGGFTGVAWGRLRGIVEQQGVTPLATIDGSGVPLLEGHVETLPHLPGPLVNVVVDFYRKDAFLTAALQLIVSDTFVNAAVLRRTTYLDNLRAFCADSYLPVAEAAMFRLDVYCRLRALVPF